MANEGVEVSMKRNRRWQLLGALFVAAMTLGAIFVWNIGSVLIAPANHPIGRPPGKLQAEDVAFPSASGAMIHGWFVPGQPGRGAVVLMHGIHADRRSLVARAEFLARAGYAMLLFDFQAHGESIGRQITFGFQESRDASAAVNFLRQKAPGESIGVIAISMGAAAALLAQPPLPVAALVLESCYPTLYHATEDRMADRFGFWGRLATPLLMCQLKPRLGIRPDDLKPIESANRIAIPKFFIAGTADKLTRIEESKALLAAAAAPKQFWWLEGAAHVDMHAFAPAEYERQILEFLAKNLNPPAQSLLGLRRASGLNFLPIQNEKRKT